MDGMAPNGRELRGGRDGRGGEEEEAMADGSYGPGRLLLSSTMVEGVRCLVPHVLIKYQTHPLVGP